jgi:hypothetical protein
MKSNFCADEEVHGDDQCLGVAAEALLPVNFLAAGIDDFEAGGSPRFESRNQGLGGSLGPFWAYGFHAGLMKDSFARIDPPRGPTKRPRRRLGTATLR